MGKVGTKGVFMSKDIYDEIYTNFKTYYPFLDEEVSSWSPNGLNSIIAELFDGTIIEYNDALRSFRTVRKFDETEESWKREFASKLIKMMADKGCDQTYLSEISGVSQVSISNYLNKKAIPNCYTVFKLSKALGCNVSDLMDF